MTNLVKTYQLIADLLDSNDAQIEALHLKLKSDDIDWDTFVVEGSKHLVLPALYCNLKSKNLLYYLPEELQIYLEEITSINRNRNTSILKQANELSDLFNTHNINHVFLKGTALCATNYFEDIAQRMIGDIDILIEKEKLQYAYELLEENGYTGVKTTIGDDFFEHKHLPRLMPKEHLCAVELHLKLFVSFKLNELNPKNILANKQTNFALNIPSNEHLLLHNILNHQINDNGKLYNNIDFRASYDTIVLLQKVNLNHFDKTFTKRPFKNYFKNLSLFFSLIHNLLNIYPSLRTKIYLVRLKHKGINNFYYKFITRFSFLSIALNRFYYFTFNSNYRKAVWKDKTRIINQFQNKIALKK